MWGFCFARIRLNPLSGKIFTTLIEDFVIHRYQVIELLCTRLELRQCVFCKEPLLFWFSSRRRNCGLSESENKYYDSLILSPLLQDVPSLFSENCVQVQATLPQDCLWTPSNKKEYLPKDRPNSSCHPSFYFGFGFLRIPAPVSWWLVRHFALILNLKMRLMQPCFQRLSVHLLSAGPVIEL